MDNPVLSLKDVRKSFGDNQILRGLSMDVYKGEFITLLGESGCGKTTTLRSVAGLEQIDSGDIILDGKGVKNLPPDKRNVNTVFQNYALFPHMNVYDNIAYGPKLRGMSKNDIKRDVAEMLELVKMLGYEKRMPDQLSGGQRQRVAIARALINKPLLLLLDEPLGALDLKLRQHMQTELKSIQTQAGVTFIYVTHDQDEAINMSDRIAVMREGAFDQTGAPREIYENPETLFVARFVGDRNIMPVTVTRQQDECTIVDLGGVSVSVRKNAKYKPGDSAHLTLHTDRVRIVPSHEAANSKPGENYLPCRVISSVYSGFRTKTTVLINEEIKFIIISYNTTGGGSGGGMDIAAVFASQDAVLV